MDLVQNILQCRLHGEFHVNQRSHAAKIVTLAMAGMQDNNMLLTRIKRYPVPFTLLMHFMFSFRYVSSALIIADAQAKLL